VRRSGRGNYRMGPKGMAFKRRFPPVPFRAVAPSRAECESFANCILRDSPPVSDTANARPILTLTKNACASSEAGRVMTVRGRPHEPPPGPQRAAGGWR